MPSRGKHRLSALQVRKASGAGLLSDGGGLYLQVTKGPEGKPRRSWIFRFRAPDGRVRETGLGALDNVGLAEARELADSARKLAATGVDPIENRAANRHAAKAPKPKRLTFKEAAESYIDGHEGGWKNPKHRQQWRNTLATYVYPAFGEKPVEDIERSDLIAVLDPIWKSKNETASRLKNRVLTILEWSVARGYRTADDPAAWRKYLQKALPARSKTREVRHHPALPFEQVPSFMEGLRAVGGTSARALEFVVLTAVRTNEALQAKWSEFQLDEGLWTIPGSRMKAGREHRVPLPTPALRILRQQRKQQKGEWVFAGPSDGPLSSMALLMTLRRIKRDKITVHGFRSSFRDWAAECTNFPREVAEQALAHALPDKTEAAYRRGDLFEKRKNLMTRWAIFCRSHSDAATRHTS